MLRRSAPGPDGHDGAELQRAGFYRPVLDRYRSRPEIGRFGRNILSVVIAKLRGNAAKHELPFTIRPPGRIACSFALARVGSDRSCIEPAPANRRSVSSFSSIQLRRCMGLRGNNNSKSACDSCRLGGDEHRKPWRTPQISIRGSRPDFHVRAVRQIGLIRRIFVGDTERAGSCSTQYF